MGPCEPPVSASQQSGLPVALCLGDAALGDLDNPGIPLDQVRLLSSLEPPTVRDFVAFEEHDDTMRAEPRGAGMTDGLVEAVMGMATGLRDGFVPEQRRSVRTTTPTTLACWAYDVFDRSCSRRRTSMAVGSVEVITVERLQPLAWYLRVQPAGRVHEDR